MGRSWVAWKTLMGTNVDLVGLRAGREHSELLGAYGVTFGKFLFISVHSSCPIAKLYCPTMLSKIPQTSGAFWKDHYHLPVSQRAGQHIPVWQPS